MSNGATELLAAVARVVTAFESLGVDYLVGRSLASSLFGEPRQTLDADIVARLLARHVDPLVASLSEEFYVDQASIREAIRSQRCFNLIHRVVSR